MTIYPAEKPPPKPEPPKKPPRKMNPARKAKNWLRSYESPERVHWIQLQPCILCGKYWSQNAHIENGGRGRKADADKIVPLCYICHALFHVLGRDTFETAWNVNLATEAARVERLWQSHLRESK